MADGMDLTDVTVPTMEEIQNMKVADLKKKLKEFGLPITGNKTELVDRLQLACLSSKELDSFENSQLSLDESQINELENTDNSAALEDNDLLLFNNSSYLNSSQEDSKILDGAENKLNIISNSTSVTMPLKKRSLNKTDSEGTGVEKKVQLIRTNATHIDFSVKAASDSKPVVVASDDKNDLEEKRVVSTKTMSAAERLAMRAKRFNTGNSVATTNTSKSINSRNSKQSILSSSVPPDLDVLKKRAERFGQSVSTVMKQIEQKERLLKRKCKFGASLAISATSSIDEQAKKKQRAERFGIS